MSPRQIRACASRGALTVQPSTLAMPVRPRRAAISACKEVDALAKFVVLLELGLGGHLL